MTRWRRGHRRARGRHDRDLLFMEPTVLTGVTPEMRLMREEVFGPYLPVLTWS